MRNGALRQLPAKNVANGANGVIRARNKQRLGAGACFASLM
jgi:hypothetical protein